MNLAVRAIFTIAIIVVSAYATCTTYNYEQRGSVLAAA